MTLRRLRCRAATAGHFWLRVPALLVTVLVVLSTALAVPGALAQDPGEPVNIYGTAVDEAANPVPAGASIYAVVDGEIADSVTVDQAGTFGGPDAFDDSLAVNSGAGESVTFTVEGVDGPAAFETVDLGEASGAVEVNLTFPGETFAESAGLAGVKLSLGATTLVANGTTSATVTATFENGTAREVTGDTTLESLDPDVVTVSDTTVVGESAGTATIQATYTDGNVTATDMAEVTVEGESATLAGVAVELDDAALVEGETTAVTVTAAFSDGSETDVTDVAGVESLDPGVALVENTTVLTAGPGTATIEATYTDGNVTATDSVGLTVEPEPVELVGIDLAFADPTVEAGETTAVTVTAQFSNGSDTTVTENAVVASLDSGVATVDGATVTGESAGTATVTADYEGATDSAELTVEESGEPLFEVTALDVPATATPGETLTVTATVTNAGDAAGTATVTYEFPGTGESVTLDLVAGGSETVTFAPEAPDETGPADHTVSTPANSTTATTTVESSDPDDGSDGGSDDGGTDDGSDGGSDDGTGGDDGGTDDGSDDGGTNDGGTDDGSDDGGTDDGTGDDGGTDDGTGDDGGTDDGSDDGTGDDGGTDDGTDDGSGEDGPDDGTGDDTTDDDTTGDDGTGDDTTGDDGTGDDTTSDDGAGDGDGGDGSGAGFGILVAVCALLWLLGVRLGSETGSENS